ncbi:MAG: MATE family efflux transporter [Bacteroidaceae bacterium]|nr:MATE family efflux transporter [Bacteroidaceae bacterium]
MKIQNPILQLALPAVVTNITVPLLGIVDMTIVGHLGAAEYIGAIAIGTTIFNMLYWVFAFLRMGTTGIVSQAYGAEDRKTIRYGLFRSLILGGMLSVLLLILQEPLLRFSLWMMAPAPMVAEQASVYVHICIWGAPATLASYGLTGWFIGMQNTRIPMFTAILQNLLNIAATIVFVFVLGWGVAGVAIGTVVGLYGGLIYAMCRVGSVFPIERQIDWGVLLRRDELLRFFSVNRDIFLRTLCMVAVTVYFTTAGSRLGGLYLDANALLIQFFILYSYFTDGLANAAEALSGQYMGKNDAQGLRLVIRRIFCWGVALAFVFTVIYVAMGPWILSLLTNQAQVVVIACDYLPWAMLIPFVALPAFVWDGIYIGMTLTRQMFLSMLVSAIVFFVLWFALGNYYGNHALWLAFLAYLATRGLMQTLLFKHY